MLQLIHFDATDGLELAGLLYEPRRKTKRAAVFLHGTGGASIFDSRRTNLLAEVLLENRIAFFPFNNRGAHVLRRLRKGRRRVDAGSAHERIRECVFDIDGAVRELRRRGYDELVLIGHSTGANKIAVYDARKPRSPFRAYILLAGGDDTGLLYDALGERRFRGALEKARERIANGRGDEIVPRALSPMTLSWRAFHDMANPDGDYNVFPFIEELRGVRLGRRRPFRHVQAIRKPSLYIYGENDEFCYGDVRACTEILARHVGPKAEIVTMAEAGHSFTGYERELANLIVDWAG